jgi:hypothetical protein
MKLQTTTILLTYNSVLSDSVPPQFHNLDSSSTSSSSECVASAKPSGTTASALSVDSDNFLAEFGPDGACKAQGMATFKF